MANILRNRNVEKGDRVTIYMPMIPEAAYAMLACARHRRDPLGGVRRLLARFARAAASRTASRTSSSRPTRACAAARKVPLKANVDAAIAKVGGVDHVIVVKRTGGTVDMDPVRDVYYARRGGGRDARVPAART